MPSAGKLEGGVIESVGPDLIRLDLQLTVPPDHLAIDRYSAVIDLTTARAFTVMLIEAIEKSEIEEARGSKRKKK